MSLLPTEDALMASDTLRDMNQEGTPKQSSINVMLCQRIRMNCDAGNRYWLHRPVFFVNRSALHRIKSVHPINHPELETTTVNTEFVPKKETILSKDRILSIQMRMRGVSNEKLRAI